MTEQETNDSGPKRDPFERYRYVTYETDDESISVIQDKENERAWIQSTHTVAVEQ